MLAAAVIGMRTASHLSAALATYTYDTVAWSDDEPALLLSPRRYGRARLAPWARSRTQTAMGEALEDVGDEDGDVR